MYGIPTPSTWRVLACPVCTKVVIYEWGGKRRRKYCSPRCRPAKPKKLTSSTCQHCGQEFETRHAFQKFCRDKCRHDHRNSQPEFKAELLRRYREYLKTESGRAVIKRRKIRRKKLMSGVSEVVLPATVFARDRWQCQLCGCRVRQTGRDYFHDRATMDHIIPLSRGGSHTYANIQTACNLCNSKKNAKSIGQLRIF